MRLPGMVKRYLGKVFWVGLVVLAGFATTRYVRSLSAPEAPAVIRFDNNPIITADLFDGPGGENINGPSLIRVPD